MFDSRSSHWQNHLIYGPGASPCGHAKWTDNRMSLRGVQGVNFMRCDKKRIIWKIYISDKVGLKEIWTINWVEARKDRKWRHPFCRYIWDHIVLPIDRIVILHAISLTCLYLLIVPWIVKYSPHRIESVWLAQAWLHGGDPCVHHPPTKTGKTSNFN